MTKLMPDHYIYLNPYETAIFKEVNLAGSRSENYPLYILQPKLNGNSLLHQPKLAGVRKMLMDHNLIKSLNFSAFDLMVLNNLRGKICTNQQILDIRKQF